MPANKNISAVAPPSSQTNPMMIGMEIGRAGRPMEPKELKRHWKLRGLCENCGITQTHGKNKFGLRSALTIEGKVYKGYCLDCYTINKNSSAVPKKKSVTTIKKLAVPKKVSRSVENQPDESKPKSTSSIHSTTSESSSSRPRHVNKSSQDASDLNQELISQLHKQASESDFSGIVQTMRNNRHSFRVHLVAYQKLRDFPADKESEILTKLTSIVRVIVENVESKSDDTDLHAQACGVLWRLSTINKDTKLNIAHLRGLDSILKTMTKFGDETDKIWAYGALTNLLTEDNNRSIFKKNHGMKIITSDMNNRHLGPTVREWVCRALWTLSFDTDELRDHINKRGAINLICDAMQNNTSLIGLQEWCCRTLWSLFSSRKRLRGANGIFGIILKVMEEHPNIKSIQYYTCGALSQVLCCVDTPLPVEKASAAAKAIVKALETHVDSVEVQEQACWALLKLCHDDETNAAVASVGCVEAMCNVIGGHPGQSDVQEKACDVLSLIYTKTGSGDIDMELKKHISSVANMIGFLSVSENISENVSSALARLTVNFCVVLHDFSADDYNNDTKTVVIIIESVMEAMGTCSSNADVQEAACSLLSTFSSISDENKNMIVSTGKMDNIISAMKRHITSAEVQEKACNLLSNLLTKQYNGLFSASPSMIYEIKQSMKRHNLNEAVQEAACRAIHNIALCADDECSSALKAIIDEIIKAMSNHPNSQPVQKAACGALWSLSAFSEQHIHAIVSNHGINALCESLAVHTDSEAIQEEALGALLNFSTHEKYIPAMSQHGLRIIIRSISNPLFRENVQLQEKAITILSIWSSSSFEIKMEILDDSGANALDAINGLLHHHIDSRDILMEVFATLANLSVNNDIKFDIATMGMSQIVQAMNRYPDDVNLQQEGCGTLCNLISGTPNEILHESEIVRQIITSMSTHPDCFGMQEKGVGALWNLSFKEGGNKERIIAFGGIDIIIKAMREHLGSTPIVEKGCVALWSLAEDDENRRLIGKAGGCSAIINGMMAQIESRTTQEEALGALLTLGTESDNKSRIKNHGGIDAVVMAMRAYYEHSNIQEKACHAISNIAVDLTTNQVALMSRDELDVVVTAMRMHSDNENVQKKAIMLLKNYAFGQSNVELMSSSFELQDLLETACQKYPYSCMERCLYVLDCMKNVCVM